MLGIPACNYKRYAFKMMKRIITSLKHLKRKQKGGCMAESFWAPELR